MNGPWIIDIVPIFAVTPWGLDIGIKFLLHNKSEIFLFLVNIALIINDLGLSDMGFVKLIGIFLPSDLSFSINSDISWQLNEKWLKGGFSQHFLLLVFIVLVVACDSKSHVEARQVLMMQPAVRECNRRSVFREFNIPFAFLN